MSIFTEGRYILPDKIYHAYPHASGMTGVLAVIEGGVCCKIAGVLLIVYGVWVLRQRFSK